SKSIQIKKGLNIPLAGAPSQRVTVDNKTKLFALSPSDFPGYTWKAVVKVGDAVGVGSPLLMAKEDEFICLTAPVSGVVKEIRRGERRKIEYISVESDGKFFLNPELAQISDHWELLKRSGLFAMIRQRPFDVVPGNDTPRDIFVTAFDTAPLAPDILAKLDKKKMEDGLRFLRKFTKGTIYLSIPEEKKITSGAAQLVEFNTLHPAGNVGVQIANIKPVNKGETVWTLDVVTAEKIGWLVSDKKLSFNTRVAITGPDAIDPHIVETYIGASLSTLLEGEIKPTSDKVRVISGNVLTGVKENVQTGFLRFPYRQVTLIDEGDNADEFMGWASLNPKKFSVKRSFPAFLAGLSRPFNFDARIKGGHRAMILSGEYAKVFPFDIYPEYLLKAIYAKDIEKMEKLGIYEVAPEDFALPEFVDTSKNELQKAVREGLDYLRKETL
ncbi:MAG: NADH:ubiquinone reductase (Na(+)-transporting) subunit A, partial [Muribaculaceae bacterium]|nr:NADH:ubiquinone reductase (Na(+)-transporting) subunit A [Muribaculaceae bacterium]